MHLVEAGLIWRFASTEDLWRIYWFRWVLLQECAAVRSTGSIFILIYRTQEFNGVAGLVRCIHAISFILGVWIETVTICRYTSIECWFAFSNLTVAFHICLGLPPIERLSSLWRSILIWIYLMLSIFIVDLLISQALLLFLVCEFHYRALEWRYVVGELLIVCILLVIWGSQ